MSGISKSFSLLLIALLAVSSLIMAKPASAQSIPTPSVPTFTLKIVARPFSVAPSTTVDPYTGQTTITQNGYSIQNQSIDVTITNQPFTSYSVNGSEVNLWYQVQYKGHYDSDWQLYSYSNSITPVGLTQYCIQSNGGYTTISVPINSDEPLNPNGEQVGSVTNFPVGGQVDFQVRALIGQPNVEQEGQMGDMVFFNGETGDWSNTQTITVPATSASPNPTTSQTPSPTPTATPTVPEFSSITIYIIIIALLVVIVSLLLYMRKRKPVNSSQQTVSNSGI